MDKSIKWYTDQKIKRTMESLKNNNIEPYYVKSNEELLNKVQELLKEDSTVAVGGSMTLKETGVLDLLRNGKYNFLDRYKKGLSRDDIKEIYRKSFFADTYLTSTNAITENGELYNIDGHGNRVSAMIYGPDQVIVITGTNKIVKNIEEAKERVKNYAAPINAKRLSRDTPCAVLGYCVDCQSDDRICSNYVVMKRQGTFGRIKVIIVDGEYGY